MSAAYLVITKNQQESKKDVEMSVISQKKRLSSRFSPCGFKPEIIFSSFLLTRSLWLRGKIQRWSKRKKKGIIKIFQEIFQKFAKQARNFCLNFFIKWTPNENNEYWKRKIFGETFRHPFCNKEFIIIFKRKRYNFNEKLKF